MNSGKEDAKLPFRCTGDQETTGPTPEPSSVLPFYREGIVAFSECGPKALITRHPGSPHHSALVQYANTPSGHGRRLVCILPGVPGRWLLSPGAYTV